MKSTNNIFFYIAVLGLLLGLIIHIISLSGIYIGDDIPFIWLLHIGIFVVWIPSIIRVKNREKKLKAQNIKSNDPLKKIKLFVGQAPKPIIILAGFLFLYAMVNFFLFMQAGQGGGPSIIDGQYVISNHGNIIKEITQTEYVKMQANELRGFSGYWLAFYSIAMMILWPNKKTE